MAIAPDTYDYQRPAKLKLYLRMPFRSLHKAMEYVLFRRPDATPDVVGPKRMFTVWIDDAPQYRKGLAVPDAPTTSELFPFARKGTCVYLFDFGDGAESEEEGWRVVCCPSIEVDIPYAYYELEDSAQGDYLVPYGWLDCAQNNSR